MRKAIRASVLIMALAIPAFAGNIPNDVRVTGETPNNITAAGEMQNGVTLGFARQFLWANHILKLNESSRTISCSWFELSGKVVHHANENLSR
ncbi:MAG TPA: hypothetical protein VF735_13165 [Pyrinomonadaceae bacterium]|jgi:hypothetical protein